MLPQGRHGGFAEIAILSTKKVQPFAGLDISTQKNRLGNISPVVGEQIGGWRRSPRRATAPAAKPGFQAEINSRQEAVKEAFEACCSLLHLFNPRGGGAAARKRDAQTAPARGGLCFRARPAGMRSTGDGASPPRAVNGGECGEQLSDELLARRAET
jgi:hypothetical protein